MEMSHGARLNCGISGSVRVKLGTFFKIIMNVRFGSLPDFSAIAIYVRYWGKSGSRWARAPDVVPIACAATAFPFSQNRE